MTQRIEQSISVTWPLFPQQSFGTPKALGDETPVPTSSSRKGNAATSASITLQLEQQCPAELMVEFDGGYLADYLAGLSPDFSWALMKHC